MKGPEDDLGLTGKVAIVSGGGAAGDGIGNGRAAAILLARAGCNVLVVDRDLKLAERTVAMIAAEGGNAVATSYDVTESKRLAAIKAGAVPVTWREAGQQVMDSREIRTRIRSRFAAGQEES